MKKISNDTLMRLPLIISGIISIAIVGIDVAIYLTHPEWKI